MSRSIHEHFRQLEAEVQQLHVLPASAVRARGRRRGRRQLAVGVAAVAVVATTAGVAATSEWPRQRPAAPGPAAAQSAAQSQGGLRCVTDLPSSPDAVRIRVLAAGASAEVVEATANQLRERRFSVVGDSDSTTEPRDSHPAVVRYGPLAIGAATLVRAELRGEVTMWFDPGRRDEIIDLALGATFDRLSTPTEVNQSLVSAGEPTAPPQC